MLEEHCVEEGRMQRAFPRNAVAYYFERARELELGEAYVHFLSGEAKQSYSTILQEAYDVLFDRVMTSRISPFLKEEMENWYSFHKDFLGFCDTKELNRELEAMLGRFELL
jgi:hypothetical protein